MARTYRNCPACGKRALTIATRCPGCAHELRAEPVGRQPSRGTGRRIQLPAIAAGLLTVVGLLALVMRRGAHRDPDVAATPDLRAEATLARDTVRAAASPLVPDSAPSAEAMPRVARTWTKVRARRSTSGDVVAVLLPGDTVLVDSLQGGWWRVALDRRVLGYVHRRTLVGN